MNNFKQPGNTLDYIATAVVAGGVPVLIGTVLVIPSTNAGIGQSYAGWIEGVFELPCATGTAWAQHDVLYWDNTNKRLTTTATNNTRVGMAAYPKVAAAATGQIKLLPQV